MANKAKLKRTLRKQILRQIARSEDGRARSSSRPSPSAPSRWPQRPAAEREALESLDTHAKLRNGLRRLSEERDHWAGIPMPLDGERLVVEPRYPYAKGLEAIGGEKPEEDDGLRLRNVFTAHRKGARVLVVEKQDGRVIYGLEPAMNHLTHDLRTLGCSEAWGIEQESNAVHTLGSLVSHRQFKQYMLTGMFLEQSKRSGVHYLFRRLKPTVAIRAEGETTRILCALCLHPIAYYAGSWAGAMTPTDDVIAHLTLMRGDEVMFWRRSTQHSARAPEAGI